MTTGSKTALFFIAATAFNILTMVICVAVFLVLGALVRVQPWSMIIWFVGFIGSIVVTFLVYGAVMKWATVRFELEKHLPGLFKKGRK